MLHIAEVIKTQRQFDVVSDQSLGRTPPEPAATVSESVNVTNAVGETTINSARETLRPKTPKQAKIRPSNEANTDDTFDTPLPVSPATVARPSTRSGKPSIEVLQERVSLLEARVKRRNETINKLKADKDEFNAKVAVRDGKIMNSEDLDRHMARHERTISG